MYTQKKEVQSFNLNWRLVCKAQLSTLKGIDRQENYFKISRISTEIVILTAT